MSESKSVLKILVIAILMFSLVSSAPPLPLTTVKAVPANPSSWFYNGWQYRRAHDLTNNQTADALNFFSVSPSWITISGNPTQRHTLQPVHNSTIVEVNKRVDGHTWKYLAYDCDAVGFQIRLYYSNDTAGVWYPYSQNPILGPKNNYYRWPSTTYINGAFHMFLESRTTGTLERWTSTDGIKFTFLENVKVGGNEYKNPFIWFNINDNKWYLYTHDAVGNVESIKVRSAGALDGLKTASDSVIVSQMNFLFGSPSVMFYDDRYWLLAEILIGKQWHILAYYSNSPASGFVETTNSPIMINDEACPMIFFTPDQSRVLLYTTTNSGTWYQKTHEVYLTSPIIPQPVDLADYQIKLTVNYGNGTSAGDNVQLNGQCKPDFSDVRFTWYNETLNSEVECPYWIEQLTPGSQAVFWVKIPKIPSTGTSTLYIYYGNSDAATTSNGDATFDFFDDFSGDLNKWTVLGGSWQVQNGELGTQTSAFGHRLRANNFVFGSHSVHVNVKWVSGTYFEAGPYVRAQSANELNNGYITFLSARTSVSQRIAIRADGITFALASQGTTSPSPNEWYSYTFKLSGNVLRSSISPLYPTEINARNGAFSTGTLCLFSWSNVSENVHYDNLFVTKYSYPEPAQASWYSEEKVESIQPTPTPSPTPEPTPNPTAAPQPTPTAAPVPTPSPPPKKHDTVKPNSTQLTQPKNASKPSPSPTPTVTPDNTGMPSKLSFDPIPIIIIAVSILLPTLVVLTISRLRREKTTDDN